MALLEGEVRRLRRLLGPVSSFSLPRQPLGLQSFPICLESLFRLLVIGRRLRRGLFEVAVRLVRCTRWGMPFHLSSSCLRQLEVLRRRGLLVLALIPGSACCVWLDQFARATRSILFPAISRARSFCRSWAFRPEAPSMPVMAPAGITSTKPPICRCVPNCREYRGKAINYAERLTAPAPAGATSSFPSIAFACSAQCSISQRSKATGGSAGA